MSDLMRAVIAIGITAPAATLLITGIKLDNPNLKSAGLWLGGFQAGFIVMDVYYMSKELRDK